MVTQHRVPPGLNRIDISALTPGIYTCSVATERMRTTRRSVKE